MYSSHLVVTCIPVPSTFVVPEHLHAAAARLQFRLRDRVERGERYLHFDRRFDGDDIAAHIDDWFDEILGLMDLIRADCEQVPIQFGGVIYGSAQEGMSLSSEQVAALGRRSVSIDIQTYCIDP